MLQNLLPSGFGGLGEAALSALLWEGPGSHKKPLHVVAAAAAHTPVQQKLVEGSGVGRGGFSKQL